MKKLTKTIIKNNMKCLLTSNERIVDINIYDDNTQANIIVVTGHHSVVELVVWIDEDIKEGTDKFCYMFDYMRAEDFSKVIKRDLV